MTRIAYFDCFSGVSGDMTLGALVDAGLDLEYLRAELGRLPLAGYTLSARPAQRGGLRGVKVDVEIEERGEERGLHEIEAILSASSLSDEVKSRSLAIFERLAAAEARVHGVSPEEVHFHEVGAVDAIVDVVGAVIGLRAMGVEQVYASPVHVGSGVIRCAHGLLPAPAPATMELLRGAPIYGGDVEAELATPTGAAILATLAQGFGAAPPMRVERIGYGAGSRDLPIPNLLRISIGESWGEQDPGAPLAALSAAYDEDRVWVIEANVDDMNPQWYEHACARLFEAGALDVSLTPVLMKRGRPAEQIGVIAPEERVAAVLEALFAETTTIGARAYPARRWKLPREQVVVQTPYGPVGVKVARRGEAILNIAPEHRDCQRAAEESGAPLKEVYQAAWAAARRDILGADRPDNAPRPRRQPRRSRA